MIPSSAWTAIVRPPERTASPPELRAGRGTSYLDGLNPEQRTAVEETDGRCWCWPEPAPARRVC